MRQFLIWILASSVCCAVAQADCGLSATCEDVQTSFVGHIEIGQIRVHWETDDETVAVGYYLVRRIPKGGAPVLIARKDRAGTCGTAKLYEVVDENPPQGTNDYSVTVHKLNGDVGCGPFVVHPEEP